MNPHLLGPVEVPDVSAGTSAEAVPEDTLLRKEVR